MQHPYEISSVLGLDEIHGIDLRIDAYPNPMNDFITLKVETENNTDLSYQIFDLNGRLFMQNKVLYNETNIELRNFVAASYFLKVFKNNKEVKTFKIIKN